MENEELNKWIHEQIFKGCWHETEVVEEPYPGYVRCPKCGASVLKRKFCGWDIPDYCNSIADAWRVLEKLREFGWAASLYAPGILYEFDSKFYQCQLQHKTIFQGGGVVEKDESITKAICQAARAALESQGI